MRQHKRPFLATLLALSVLTLTAYNAVRFGTALMQWYLILDLMPNPGPFYIAATGLLWTLSLFGVFLNLWFGWKWVPPITAIALLLYSAYYWLDRFIFQSAQPRENWLFALAVTTIYLLFAALVLALPGSRKFFNTQRE